MPKDYEQLKEESRERNRKLSLKGRDISPLPEVVDPDRKERCRENFSEFARNYFPEIFSLEWSPDHLKIIGKIENAVLRGGLFALAMPRASGKTTLAETASLWSMLYGHRRFIVLIGSSEDAAGELLSSLKGELENNELLLEDFPEVVYPIHCLEGIANRTKGQLYEGKRTQISWTGKEIVLPSIPSSPAFGVICKTTGVTGRIRGMKHRTSDGESIRPELVIVDDCQTDESARSPSQVATRENILSGAVLGLSAPNTKISGIFPCTVIRKDDLASRLLDHDRHPEWQGERMKMVYQWPDSKLWDEYAEIREDDYKSGGDGSKATEFYKNNREEMDEGSLVAWEQRFNGDELSAIQHAWNLRLRDEESFFAEYQNQPIIQETESVNLQTDQIFDKVVKLKENEVTQEIERLTAFVDVQGSLLYYVVTGWTSRFSGHVIDFGAFPDQGTKYFTLKDASPTFKDEFPSQGMEGQIFSALESLVPRLLKRRYQRDDGSELSVEMLLIDANYGQSTDVVYRWCRQSEHRTRIFPSHGRYVGASSQPFHDYRKKKGDRLGLNWRIPSIRGKRSTRYVLYDTNFWKSFIASRINTATGDSGSLTIFGANKNRMQMFADQLTAEYTVRTQGRGREVDEWKLRPERSDNHFLDCLVGTAVAASMLGCDLIKPRKAVTDKTVTKKRDSVSYL